MTLLANAGLIALVLLVQDKVEIGPVDGIPPAGRMALEGIGPVDKMVLVVDVAPVDGMALVGATALVVRTAPIGRAADRNPSVDEATLIVGTVPLDGKGSVHDMAPAGRTAPEERKCPLDGMDVIVEMAIVESLFWSPLQETISVETTAFFCT